MRARIGTLSRRLAKAEAGTLTADGELRGGVMLVPPIEYDIDRWSALASAQQAALSEACREDTDRHRMPAPHREPMPAPLNELVEGIDFHYPDPHRGQTPEEVARRKRPPLPPVR